MSKLKNFAKTAVLTGALATALAGCTTYGNWEKTYSEWEPTGTQKREVIDTRKESDLSRKLSIGNLGENHNFKIEEIQKQDNSQIDTYGIRKELQEVASEQRKISTYPRGILTGAGSGLGFGIFLNSIATVELTNEEKIGIGLLSTGVFSALGLFFDVLHDKTEKRNSYTGVTRLENNAIRDGNERSSLGMQVLYDGAAKNSSVILSLDKFSKKTRTNGNGELSLSAFLQSAGPNYFFADEIPSSSELEKIARSSSLVQQIKKPTLDILLNEIVKNVFNEQIKLTVTTDEIAKPGEKIENDSKSFAVNYYEISNDAVYGIVKSFVDKEINSYIKNLTFDVKDITTRVPINGANFRMNSNAPSPIELAGKYFTDNLMEYARKQIKDYLFGETLYQGNPSRVIFPIYVPSNISYEVTHPDYKYVIDSFSVNGDRKGVVYMIDKGSKIRVESESNATGMTEWAK